MRRWTLLMLGLSLAAPLVTGCGSGDGASGNGSVSPLLRSAARAVLVARAYDRAALAARREDRDGFAAAAQELHRLEAAPQALRLVNGAVGRVVERANRFYILSQLSTGELRAQWLAQADAEFRYALRLAPGFDSSDPQMLNTIGYFLAENGKTQADFREAERLTRRALQLWDQRLQKMPSGDPDLPRLRFERAYTAHDSFAWALFKQGRYEEALVEQKKAVDVAAANAAAPEGGGPPLADLHYHLAEIYRALKRPADAITYYQVALRFKPDHEDSRRALKALTGSDRPESSPTPQPTAVAL